MLLARGILGRASEPRFRGRRVERVRVDAAEASKRRLRRATDAGTDVAVSLTRGSYLVDEAVLDDDGERIVVVERTRQDALILTFSETLDADALSEQSLRLGHVFGNRHIPIEVKRREVRAPVTTSRDIMQAMVDDLALEGTHVRFATVKLACERPLLGQHGHA